MFGGRLTVTIDRRDFDPLIVLYEQMPDGRYLHLSYYLGRASYAKDMTERNLLTPGRAESIEDAGGPLRVEWHNDSFIEIQVRR